MTTKPLKVTAINHIFATPVGAALVYGFQIGQLHYGSTWLVWGMRALSCYCVGLAIIALYRLGEGTRLRSRL